VDQQSQEEWAGRNAMPSQPESWRGHVIWFQLWHQRWKS